MAEPRHLILPGGIVSSGWPAIRDTSARVGIFYDPWQQGLNRAMLAKDGDGLYAADTVGLSLCRQSGKTYDVGGVTFADSIIHPGTTTIWTAHRFPVARETFTELMALASTPKMSPHVDPHAITTGAGNECIPFRNGSRIVFKARERGAIRGFAKVRRLVLDEAQILTESAMADLVPTTNHAWNPQIILMGTPPKPKDPSEVFSKLRAESLDGDTVGVLWCEYGADHDCDLDSWEAVKQANPSFPLRTPKRAILRLRKLLGSDDDFAREALGIWDQARYRGVLPEASWMSQVDEDSIPTGRFALGVECGPDLAWASVALAGQRDDGAWHIELDDDQHTRGRGVAWLVPQLEALVARNPEIRTVVADVAGPVAALLEERRGRWFFKGTQLEVYPVKVRELGTGCSLVLDGVVTGWLWHIGQPQLSAAALSAGKRTLGDTGMWVWSRKTADSDITPVQAGTLALIGAQAEKPVRPVRATARRREAVVL